MEFKDYAADCFHNLRTSAGLTREAYMASFRHPLKTFGTGGGKSAARFFMSADSRFILKSCTKGHAARKGLTTRCQRPGCASCRGRSSPSHQRSYCGGMRRSCAHRWRRH